MTKTVVAQTYGTPEVLKLVDVDLPAPKSGEVLVDVKAIGVNPFDFKLYSGAFGTDPEKLPIRLGGEAAGVVSAVGDGVTNVNVGDEVIVSPGNGLYSEQVVVPVSSVTAKPAGISWEQAAGLLLVGGTAVDALDTIRVGSGDTVLIHGASGGVGAIAVQLAVGRGATVIGTAGASNQDYVRSLGATPVLYGHGLEARVRELAPNGVDAAFDTAGTDEAVAGFGLRQESHRHHRRVRTRPDRRLRFRRRRQSGKCGSAFEGTIRTCRTSRFRTPHREDRQDLPASGRGTRSHRVAEFAPRGKVHPRSVTFSSVLPRP